MLLKSLHKILQSYSVDVKPNQKLTEASVSPTSDLDKSCIGLQVP